MVSKKQQVNAVNDSTKTSSISWWHGWHLFHCISPMSLQDRTIFTDKQHLATDLARSPRTVSPGEQWCKLICERSEWFHKNKFDIMMAWMTPVSLHFSDVSTGSNNLYRQTTLGYWFSTFATNLLHTRTIQCKEFVLRSLRPRLLRLTSKHHCRIDMQTEQWSSLWTYQFRHKLPHQTNRAPHVLARMH